MSLLQIWKITTHTHMKQINFDKHTSECNFILPPPNSRRSVCRHHSPLIAIDKWKVLYVRQQIWNCVVQQRQRWQKETNCNTLPLLLLFLCTTGKALKLFLAEISFSQQNLIHILVCICYFRESDTVVGGGGSSTKACSRLFWLLLSIRSLLNII